MQRIFRFTGTTAALVAVLATMGGHWMFLQSVAWSRMIVEYSSSYGLTEGLSRTFDGDHPCPMCKSIEQAKVRDTSATEGLAVPTPPLRMEALLSSFRLRLPDPADRDDRYRTVTTCRSQFSSEPAVPPPRVVPDTFV